MKLIDYPNLSVSKRKQHLPGVVLITLLAGLLPVAPLAHAQGSSPTIEVSSSSTPFLDPPFVSGVIDDPTDPAATIGIDFEILDAEDFPFELQVTATSDDETVATTNLSYSGGDQWNLKITPVGVGSANIIVTVTDTDLNETSYPMIQYAASAASVNPATTRFHTGSSEASSAISVGENYMLVADNEDEVIRLYHRQQSGLPIKKFNFRNDLELTDTDNNGNLREVDLEASTRVDDRIYWLGSHSNSNSGNIRENRYRLFAADVTGSGENTTLTFID